MSISHPYTYVLHCPQCRDEKHRKLRQKAKIKEIEGELEKT